MSWHPGRGRPIAMPGDFSPLRGRTIDARSRVAWLLRVSRLAHSPGPAAGFLEKLRAHGPDFGQSTLCRYETGIERVPVSVVRGYELALGLRPGQLLGACAGLDRVFGPAFAPETAPLPYTRDEVIRRLGDWESGIASGSMHGADWVLAAEALSRPTGPVLPPSVLQQWVVDLVSETMRSTRHAFTTRSHAVGLLVNAPGFGPAVREAVDVAISVPGAQSAAHVLAVMGSSPDPGTVRWLLRIFEESEGDLQWGAAFGLLCAICRGSLPADVVPALSRAVLDAAGDGMVRGRPAFLIAQRLSAQLTQRVVTRLGTYPAPTAAGARVQSPAGLSEYRAAALRASGLDDPMLDRLLREALSPDFVERRHHSLLMLAASPYRGILAEVALRLLSTGGEPWIRESAGHCLAYLAGGEQRGPLLELLLALPERRPAMLTALVRSGGVPFSVDLVGLTGEPGHDSALVYAAGMSGHPSLQTFASTEGSLSGELQVSAQWWLQVGPAVTDTDEQESRPGTLLHLAG